MERILERVAGFAARVALREGVVAAVSDLGEFRRLDLSVPGARFAAGQKVQFRVRGIEFRTFTPFDWGGGSVSFLVWRHGTGPAAAWSEALEPGRTVQMFGPRGAIDLDRLPSAPIFVGDETSFALTAAWRLEKGLPVVAHLYEVGSEASSAELLGRLGLEPASLLARAPGGGHREELARRAVELVRRHPEASVALTGNVQTIRAVRDALKSAGLTPPIKAKAHWDPARRGLD